MNNWRISSRADSTASVPIFGITLSTTPNFFAALLAIFAKPLAPPLDCRRRRSASRAPTAPACRALCRMVSVSPPSTPPVSRIMSGRRLSISSSLSVGEFKRRRADDLRSGAERGLIGSFNGQARHVADHGDAQAAGGAAARQHRLSLETRKSLGGRSNNGKRSCKSLSACSKPSRTSVSTVDGAWLRPINRALSRSTAVTFVKVLPKSMRMAREVILRCQLSAPVLLRFDFFGNRSGTDHW